jgi:hypothetical protein
MEIKWISIKDKMPEDKGHYLVTYYNHHIDDFGTDVLLWYNCSRSAYGEPKMRWSSKGDACQSTVLFWAEMPEPCRE